MIFVCGGRSRRLKSGAPELPYSAAMQGRVWLDSAMIAVLSKLQTRSYHRRLVRVVFSHYTASLETTEHIDRTKTKE
jgi:hypothetical protein